MNGADALWIEQEGSQEENEKSLCVFFSGNGQIEWSRKTSEQWFLSFFCFFLLVDSDYALRQIEGKGRHRWNVDD